MYIYLFAKLLPGFKTELDGLVHTGDVSLGLQILEQLATILFGGLQIVLFGQPELDQHLERLTHSFRVDQSFELRSSRHFVVLTCASGFQVGKIRVPREGEQEIRLRCESGADKTAARARRTESAGGDADARRRRP